MKFWLANPERAINCGIAEANMMGVAAGLAAMGKSRMQPPLHLLLQKMLRSGLQSIAYAKMTSHLRIGRRRNGALTAEPTCLLKICL